MTLYLRILKLDSKLKYCGCHCGQVATMQITLVNKKDENKKRYDYRCDKHSRKGTKTYRVVNIDEFDQSWKLQKINEWLETLVGKKIMSSFHNVKTPFEVKYQKKEIGGLMCLSKYNHWKLVYAEQISQIST